MRVFRCPACAKIVDTQEASGPDVVVDFECEEHDRIPMLEPVVRNAGRETRVPAPDGGERGAARVVNGGGI